MGFFKKLLGFGDQMFQSEEEKLKNVQKTADALKQLLAGRVVQKGDDDVVVQGMFEGYPTSIEISVDFGSFEIELKTRAGYPESMMTLAHDGDGARAKIAGAEQAPDAFGEIKVFLAKTIYLEGDQQEVATWQNLLKQLPTPLVQELLTHLESSQGRCSFSKNEISMKPWAGDVAAGKAIDQITAHLKLLVKLARATESTWR